MSAHENQEFDADRLIAALRQRSEPEPDGELPPPLAVAEPVPAPVDDLAAQLTATAAPAVGLIGFDTEQSLSTQLQAHAGTGVYARGGLGRQELRATLAHVDRERIGRYVLTVDGARYVRPDVFVPPAGASGEAVVRWLTDAVVGLRSTTDSPILVTVSAWCDLHPDQLEALAVEADCIVAVLEPRPGLVAPVWEPHLLEAKPAPALPAPEIRRPSAAARLAQHKGGAAGWLASVSDLVQGYPEVIPGPNGERVSAHYGQRDARGREHVTLTAHVSRADGRMWPMELELAPGVLVALEDCRIYTREARPWPSR